MAGAWGLSEVLGRDHHSPNGRVSRHISRLCLIYVFAHVLGAVVVPASLDLVSLAVDIEVTNVLLMPMVLGFLLALEARTLAQDPRIGGLFKEAIPVVCRVVVRFGLYMVPTLAWG